MSDAAILGVDWGSTSLRIMRIAIDGRILDVRRAADGVFTSGGDFAARLTAHLGDWPARDPSAPVILCGMVGSDRGWVCAPYVHAPAGVEEIAGALASAPFERAARIVPGVSFVAGDEAEVMRGEETIALGFLAHTGLSDALLCLPGTHSKWLQLRSGRIERFRTYMTGEMRARLLAEGALATNAEQAASPTAFRAGLNASEALSRGLFQARARRLLGSLAATHTAAFVSGVLIGAELAAEVKEVTETEEGSAVFVAAGGTLADDYRTALDHAGISYTLIDSEPLAALGLVRIAQRAGFAILT